MPPFDAKVIDAAWKEALDVWETRVNLSPPASLESVKQSHWPGDDPLAYIDLETRQVVVNFVLLSKIASKSLPAVLAHEIGHHVKFPRYLSTLAELQLLEKRLLPGLPQSLVNLFLDLQVNEYVGRTHANQLAAVYRGFPTGTVDPVFAFYLAIYEALWGLSTGDLSSPATMSALDEKFPGALAEARVFRQTFYELPTTHLQFAYFCSRFFRYVDLSKAPETKMPLAHDAPTPGEEDYSDAIFNSSAVSDAIAEATERGWFLPEEVNAEGVEVSEEALMNDIDRLCGHNEGGPAGKYRKALVGEYYRRLVDRYLFEIPSTPQAPEATLPTTTEEWEPGDDVRAIDWTQSVLVRGGLAGALPLQRTMVADTETHESAEIPNLELYLDTSGSMPSPQRALNAMTLAAQILATATLRAGGRARCVIYSSGKPLVSEWMYDESVARDFLLHFQGGGTDYPFQLLEKFVREDPDVLRVVVSDDGFLYNCNPSQAKAKLEHAIVESRLFVILLSLWGGEAKDFHKTMGPGVAHANCRIVTVKSLQDFGAMASDLARSLFD